MTGDVVTYYEREGGQSAVAIDAAPRPGPAPVFRTSTGPDDFYVVPSDAERYVTSGVVDRELFDVKELIKEGLTDASAEDLRLVVSYRNRPSPRVLAHRADALPGSDLTVTLPTIDAAAVRVERTEATAFWRALRPGLGGPVERLDLDRKVTVSLDRSAEEIGAPAAWKAGLDGKGVTVAVLDTGIDAGHPDLAGRVAGSRNFTEDPDASDGYGHGTHVASIIAGSGAASQGKYRGIASSAKLLNGKVLDSTGSGEQSQLMAAMEWAAHAGAKVINMSLGAGPSDGTDPVSRMVDTLSAETGALFVAAAGNSGQITFVETPAAANTALAVGAVNRAGSVARFSSRGPRLEDAGVKPEIVAPGAGIVAARASGANIGEPVGKSYTRLSGTSMATPHVAGAAAILAQKYPKWRFRELRNTLTSSADDRGEAWYEQGSGRVNIGRALNNEVVGPAAVSFGRLERLDAGNRTTRPLTYTNVTDHDVTLELNASATLWNGREAPAGALRLAKDRIVVPARGAATVTVAVDPAAGPSGPYGGLITATGAAGGTHTRTPVSFYAEPELKPLTIRLTDGSGRAPEPQSVTVIRDDYDWVDPRNNDPFLPSSFVVVVDDGTGTVEVPEGTYSVATTVAERRPEPRATLLTAAEIAVKKATTISLDARTAVPMRVETREPATTRERFAEVHRILPGAPTAFGSGVLLPGPGYQLYITPTPAAERGTVGSQDHVTLLQEDSSPGRVYNLYFRERNGIRSPHVDEVDPAELVAIPTRYHADRPDIVFRKRWFALPTDAPSSIALSGMRFQGPAQWSEYVGPVDRKVMWKRYVSQAVPGRDGRPDPRTSFSLASQDVFVTPGRRPEERWFQAPIRGRAGTRTAGDFPVLCSRCRSDKGKFLPAAQWTDSTPGHVADPWQFGNYLSKVRIYQGNREIPSEVGPEVPIPLFQLGDGKGSYRLHREEVLPEKPVFGWPSRAILRLTPRITTVATFSSAPPAGGVAPGYACLPGRSACAHQPVIRIGYQLGLDLLNQAPAGRTHTFGVTVGHHEGVEAAARITEFRLWYSTNDGARWRRATVSETGEGRYAVHIPHPRLNETNGFVTLRAEVWDDAGNRLNQTLRRAYALTNKPAG